MHDQDNQRENRRVAVRPTAALEIMRHVWNHPANTNHRCRAVGRTLRFQLNARATGRPTIVGLGVSSRVYARHDGAGSKRAAYAPIPDWPEMQTWMRHLGLGDLFVDVGANVGLYSLLAIEAGCKVVAVEPIRASAEQLEANLALNGYAAEVMCCALAEEPGSMMMSGPDALRQHLVSAGESSGIEVPVTTLDSVLAGRRAAGVKIDVEGAERVVLEGGRKALEDGRIALLQLEWNEMAELNFGEDRSGVVDMLEGYGYEFCRPDARGLLHRLDRVTLGSDVFARLRK